MRVLKAGEEEEEAEPEAEEEGKRGGVEQVRTARIAFVMVSSSVSWLGK